MPLGVARWALVFAYVAATGMMLLRDSLQEDAAWSTATEAGAHRRVWHHLEPSHDNYDRVLDDDMHGPGAHSLSGDTEASHEAISAKAAALGDRIPLLAVLLRPGTAPLHPSVAAFVASLDLQREHLIDFRGFADGDNFSDPAVRYQIAVDVAPPTALEVLGRHLLNLPPRPYKATAACEVDGLAATLLPPWAAEFEQLTSLRVIRIDSNEAKLPSRPMCPRLCFRPSKSTRGAILSAFAASPPESSRRERVVVVAAVHATTEFIWPSLHEILTHEHFTALTRVVRAINELIGLPVEQKKPATTPWPPLVWEQLDVGRTGSDGEDGATGPPVEEADPGEDERLDDAKEEDGVLMVAVGEENHKAGGSDGKSSSVIDEALMALDSAATAAERFVVGTYASFFRLIGMEDVEKELLLALRSELRGRREGQRRESRGAAARGELARIGAPQPPQQQEQHQQDQVWKGQRSEHADFLMPGATKALHDVALAAAAGATPDDANVRRILHVLNASRVAFRSSSDPVLIAFRYHRSGATRGLCDALLRVFTVLPDAIASSLARMRVVNQSGGSSSDNTFASKWFVILKPAVEAGQAAPQVSIRHGVRHLGSLPMAAAADPGHGWPRWISPAAFSDHCATEGACAALALELVDRLDRFFVARRVNTVKLGLRDAVAAYLGNPQAADGSVLGESRVWGTFPFLTRLSVEAAAAAALLLAVCAARLVGGTDGA